MSMTTQYFFSPTYFSPYYFWPLAPIGQMTPNTIGTYGDAEVFASILSILQSSRRFANVRFGLGNGQSASSPNIYPQVVVTPGKWSEEDKTDPQVHVRSIDFTIQVVVIQDDPISAHHALDLLCSGVIDAVSGSSLGGGCVPPLTRLERGGLDSKRFLPEIGAVIHGRVSYLIPIGAGHRENP